MSDLSPELLRELNRLGAAIYDKDLNTVRPRKPYTFNNSGFEPEIELPEITVESTPLLSSSAATIPAVASSAVGSSVSTLPAVLGGLGVAAVGATIYNAVTSSEERHKSPSITLPGHKYLGPGNTLNTGEEPIDDDDKQAFNHDHDYAKAKTPEEVRAADAEHILNTIPKILQGDIHSAISGSGILTKYGVESITGVKYPSFTGKPSLFQCLLKIDIDGSLTLIIILIKEKDGKN